MKPLAKLTIYLIAFLSLSALAYIQYKTPQSVQIGELSIVQNENHFVYVLDIWYGKHCEKKAYRTIKEMEADIFKMKQNPRYILSFRDLTEKAK